MPLSLQIDDNNLIAHQCEDANELLTLQKKINNLAYAELNKEIENHYNHAETPTVTREEIDKSPYLHCVGKSGVQSL